jgi:hypothetical protein
MDNLTKFQFEINDGKITYLQNVGKIIIALQSEGVSTQMPLYILHDPL